MLFRSAGTELQLEQTRRALKSKIAPLFATVDDAGKANLSAFYFIGMFLYIHGGDKAEVLRACWEPDVFFEKLHDFLQRFTTDQILSAEPVVADILKAARDKENYRVDSETPPDPNSSRRDGTPPISAPSQD